MSTNKYVYTTICDRIHTTHKVFLKKMGGVNVFMEQYNHYQCTEIGEDAMSNATVGYKALDLGNLLAKKGRIISSAEALKDVKPVDWGEEVLRGEKKVIATKEKK